MIVHLLSISEFTLYKSREHQFSPTFPLITNSSAEHLQGVDSRNIYNPGTAQKAGGPSLPKGP
jgi:hypothetical protein